MIYYKKFDEPKPYSHTVNGHLHKGVVEGEWLCDHPLVQKVWWTGSMSADHSDKTVKTYLHLLITSGKQTYCMDFSAIVTKENASEVEGELITRATEYLNMVYA